jgi:hypothetical protein
LRRKILAKLPAFYSGDATVAENLGWKAGVIIFGKLIVKRI